MTMALYVIAAGNAFDGMDLIGPFEATDDAAEFAEGDSRTQDGRWEIISVDAPFSNPPTYVELRRALSNALDAMRAVIDQHAIRGDHLGEQAERLRSALHESIREGAHALRRV
jgi:replication-associated recombination protein RarA